MNNVMLFFIALLLRVPGLTRVLIMDEPKATAAITKSFSGIVAMQVQCDSHPPMFLWFLKLWSYISHDVWFLRSMSALLGAVTCVIFYKIVESLYSRRIAYIAFILAAISPQLIFNSQYLRSYALAVFFTVAMIYILIRFIEDIGNTPYYFAALSALAALSLYTFYFSFFVLLAINIFAVYFFRLYHKKLWIWISSQILAASLFIFWLPIFRIQRNFIATAHIQAINDSKIGFYLGKIHIGNIIRILLAYLNIDDIIGGARRYSVHISNKSIFAIASLIIIIPVVLAVYKSFKEMFKEERIKKITLLFICLIFLPAAAYIVLSIGGDMKLWEHTVINMRYFGQSSIFFLIPAAFFIANIRRKLFRDTFFISILVVFAVLDMHIYQFPLSIYKPVVDYISDKGRDCKDIIICPPNALDFFNTLSDPKFSGYSSYKYGGGGKEDEAALKVIGKSGRFYLYYLKSAENMVMYPGVYENIQKFALGKGFKKKSEIIADDILVVSYFEKDKI